MCTSSSSAHAHNRKTILTHQQLTTVASHHAWIALITACVVLMVLLAAMLLPSVIPGSLNQLQLLVHACARAASDTFHTSAGVLMCSARRALCWARASGVLAAGGAGEGLGGAGEGLLGGDGGRGMPASFSGCTFWRYRVATLPAVQYLTR